MVFRRRSSTKKRNKQTDQMMRSILTHANPKRGEQRSTSARVSDSENQDKMKRRRAGVEQTNCDNLMMKWSVCQRWWEFSNNLKCFVKTVEELRRRIS